MKKSALVLLTLSLTLTASQGDSGPLKDMLRKLKQGRDTSHVPIDTIRVDTLTPRR